MNRIISIGRDPLIQDTGNRILYRRCQVNTIIRIPSESRGSTKLNYRCGRDAAYLLTYEGELTGTVYDKPLCEQHASILLGPLPKPFTPEEQQNIQSVSWHKITLQDWFYLVHSGMARNLGGIRCVVLSKPNGSLEVQFLAVEGIEHGL